MKKKRKKRLKKDKRNQFLSVKIVQQHILYIINLKIVNLFMESDHVAIVQSIVGHFKMLLMLCQYLC